MLEACRFQSYEFRGPGEVKLVGMELARSGMDIGRRIVGRCTTSTQVESIDVSRD